MTLPTPANHLPHGYPLPSEWEHAHFEPIFLRAFEIHDERLRTGKHPQGQFSSGSVCPVEGTDNYCDCYERAYREFQFKKTEEKYQFVPVFLQTETALIGNKRKIALENR